MAVDFSDGEPHEPDMGKKPEKVANAALRAARKRSGHSLVAVADAVGISQSQLSRFETGDREPRAADLKRLAEFYGVSFDEIMPGAPPPPPLVVPPRAIPARLREDILAVAIMESLISLGATPKQAAQFVAMIEQVVAANPPGFPGLSPAETTRLIVRDLAAKILTSPPE